MKKWIVVFGVIIGILGLVLGVWRLPTILESVGANEARALTPAEHASHHPDQAAGVMPAGATAPMGGMPAGGGAMMGQMGNMMKMMAEMMQRMDGMMTGMGGAMPAGATAPIGGMPAATTAGTPASMGGMPAGGGAMMGQMGNMMKMMAGMMQRMDGMMTGMGSAMPAGATAPMGGMPAATPAGTPAATGGRPAGDGAMMDQMGNMMKMMNGMTQQMDGIMTGATAPMGGMPTDSGGMMAPMGAMPDGAPAPAGGGMMDQMGDMMRNMGVPPPKELYPALMALPELSPEQREEVELQADKQMRAGDVLLTQARDALNAGARSGDYAAMREALTRMREGIAQLESGVAARRALVEGRMPRAVALQWFKSEMNLLPPAVSATPHGWYADSTFHLIVLLLLALFAAAMIWMYFFKMRRAADLLGRLSAKAPSGGEAKSGGPPPGGAKPAPDGKPATVGEEPPAVAAQAPPEVVAKPPADAFKKTPAEGTTTPVGSANAKPPAKVPGNGVPAAGAVTVTFQKSGKTAPLPPDQSILEAAEAVGVMIENSCRVGGCGVCKVKLLSGAVTMEVEDSLSAEEIAGGTILACQAKATGAVVINA